MARTAQGKVAVASPAPGPVCIVANPRNPAVLRPITSPSGRPGNRLDQAQATQLVGQFRGQVGQLPGSPAQVRRRIRRVQITPSLKRA